MHTSYYHPMHGKPLWGKLRGWLLPRKLPPHLQRAKALIKAVDSGGIPLNPMRVNQIARELGLEVTADAPVYATIERIRQALGDL